MSSAASPLGAFIAHYILYCQTDGKSSTTIRWYRQKLEYFASFLRQHQLPTRVDEVTSQAIRRFIDHLQREVRTGENNPHRPTQDQGLSPQTVAGYVRALRAFFSWAVREGPLDHHPMQYVKTPRVPSLVMPFFRDEEVARILRVMDKPTPIAKRNHAMTLVLLDTGVRVSELVGLQMSDLYLQQGYFKVMGKGHKERIVPLGRSSRQELARYVRKHRPPPASSGIEALFLTTGGYPLKPDYVYKIISGACKEVGIRGKRLGPHTCRHTFARNFLLNGGDLLTLQRILGHSSLEVVKLYVHLDTTALLAQQEKYSPMDTLRARHVV